MPTTKCDNVVMRKIEQFDISCLDAGGKTLALINVLVDEKNKVHLSIVEGDYPVSISIVGLAKR